jgi:hypothetical protein
MITIKALTRKNWTSYSSGLQELESVAVYPYGSDSFRINHGSSYFSFFERLGEPLFHIALDGNKIVACAAGVLRKIPTSGGMLKSWYLCDLKVHPNYSDQRIPARLFRKGLFLNYLRGQRAYAVSMNPKDKPNRVVEITKRFPFFPITLVGEINIYGLNFEQMNLVSDQLSSEMGSISYLSLSGKKDLIMRSTGASMKVLHVQHGPMAEPQLQKPQEGFTHMVCAPKLSTLDNLLNSKFSVAATASILAHRMSKIDWDFILTSDI